MSDVGKRSAVYECRCSFKCLYEVRLECILQECSHSALSLEVVCSYRLSAVCISYDDASASFLEVSDI